MLCCIDTDVAKDFYRTNSLHFCLLQDLYQLTVVASDDQSPDALSSTASVVVYVSDVNDNVPVVMTTTSHDVMTSSSSSNLTDEEVVSQVVNVSRYNPVRSVLARVS